MHNQQKKTAQLFTSRKGIKNKVPCMRNHQSMHL
jgi:hypothetical protein